MAFRQTLLLMVYQLVYELKTADFNYSEFYSFIEKDLGKGATRVFRDAWWFESDEDDIDALCNKIRSRLGELDTFYVALIPNGKIDGWLANITWNWYKERRK